MLLYLLTAINVCAQTACTDTSECAADETCVSMRLGTDLISNILVPVEDLYFTNTVAFSVPYIADDATRCVTDDVLWTSGGDVGDDCDAWTTPCLTGKMCNDANKCEDLVYADGGSCTQGLCWSWNSTDNLQLCAAIDADGVWRDMIADSDAGTCMITAGAGDACSDVIACNGEDLLYCNSPTSICESIPDEGEACGPNDFCRSPFHCDNGVCAASTGSPEGTACSPNAPCGYEIECVTVDDLGIYTPTEEEGTCMIKDEYVCSDVSYCNEFKFCRSGKCMWRGTTPGAPCDADGKCVAGYDCMSNVCVDPNSSWPTTLASMSTLFIAASLI